MLKSLFHATIYFHLIINHTLCILVDIRSVPIFASSYPFCTRLFFLKVYPTRTRTRFPLPYPYPYPFEFQNVYPIRTRTRIRVRAPRVPA